jgi:dTDP-4-dehydrorhamnose reductase
MKILIIGGSSVIGSKLLSYFLEQHINTEFTFFSNNIPYAKGLKLDVTQTDKTLELVSNVNPDIVIHAAALTNVDLCESNKTLADSINTNATANVIEGCKITKSKLVFISTSAIFNGEKQEYFEEDSPSPSNYYGVTKANAEELVRRSNLSYLILRTDQPYCWVEKWQHTNSVLRVLQTLKSGKILKEITDWYNTPTYVPDFVQVTKKLIDDSDKGIFHLVGPNFINRYDWSFLVAEIFRLDRTLIEPASSEILNLPAKRANVNLSNQKLFLKKNIRMIGIKDGLRKMSETRLI